MKIMKAEEFIRIILYFIFNFMLLGLFTFFSYISEFGQNATWGNPAVYASVVLVFGFVNTYGYKLITYIVNRIFPKYEFNVQTDDETITLMSLTSCVISVMYCFKLAQENPDFATVGYMYLSLIIGKFCWFDSTISQLFKTVKDIFIKARWTIPIYLYFILSATFTLFGNNIAQFAFNITFFILCLVCLFFYWKNRLMTTNSPDSDVVSKDETNDE